MTCIIGISETKDIVYVSSVLIRQYSGNCSVTDVFLTERRQATMYAFLH